MKDSEFIQLLNLYLDHEISPADAARLEAEVQANPERRKIYQQYCRMQKACKVLTTDFQTEALKVPDRKVIDFKTATAREARGGGLLTFGGLAAAACLAVVVVLRNKSETQPTQTGASLLNDSVTSVVSKPANPVAQVASTPATEAAPTHSVTPRLVNLSLSGDAQAQFVAAVEQANAQFDWIRNFQMPAVTPSTQATELRFEARPAALQTEARTFRSAQPIDATVEMAAFRFQR